MIKKSPSQKSKHAKFQRNLHRSNQRAKEFQVDSDIGHVSVGMIIINSHKYKRLVGSISS